MQICESHKSSEGKTIKSFNMKDKECLIKDVEFNKTLRYAAIRLNDPVADQCLNHWANL